MNATAPVKTVTEEAAENKARIDAINSVCHALGISADLPVTQRCLALIDRVGNLVHQSRNLDAIVRHSVRCDDLQVRIGVLETELEITKASAAALRDELTTLRKPVEGVA